MRRLLPALLLTACAAPRPVPTPATAPPPAAPLAAPARIDPRSPDALLVPCLPAVRTAEDLERAMDRAFDRRDGACWAADEIALGEALLAGHRAKDDEALLLAARHLRQAELRANRHGRDDLAALARLSRARVAMAAGDAEDTLRQLDDAARYVDLDAAATGTAPVPLDAIHVTRLIEALAEWERTGKDEWVDVAVASSIRLKAREALRAFAARGLSPADLAAASDQPEARARLAELAVRTRDLRTLWGEPLREAAPARLQTADVVVGTGAAWSAAAPLLLDWLPGGIPKAAEGVRAVLAAGEVFLDYTVGEEASALVVITSKGFEARPLPGRADLEARVERCAADASACGPLREAIVGPAEDALAGAERVLVAPHDVLHRAPFERLLAPAPVFRVPSAYALTGLRLRAWGAGPHAHPAAAGLLPGLPAAPPEAPVADAPEGTPEMNLKGKPPIVTSAEPDEALPILRAALASGFTLVEWSTGGEDPPRRYGVPLTVPATKSDVN